ncbi:hypothetical protein BTA51_26035 [Hahella sp. CCB-MM4]|uniref:DUF2523 family protein n=1 Tax=Hahella sp. (strain CCB-MM4) TaxID=1926491 RepID=UPI000B9C69FA|nr:DUF2523 family protein [Hahella sp. CCB-MM4]OZG70419.1 hypothetical protein BTA51_25975 [Hahella sp. CCB-MM4]OZG70431.1 hypothetical protein BTA51_26035 [Hahella sp. CCB-MM4]
MDAIFEFFNTITDWLTTDQYSFWEELVAYVLVQVTIWKIEFMIWSMQFSWGVAHAILDQLNISAQINQLWGNADATVAGWLTFLRVPDAMNMVLSAGVTKFVMRMVGFA